VKGIVHQPAGQPEHHGHRPVRFDTQIAALSVLQLAALSATNVSALNATQTAALSTTQIKGLTTTQVKGLSAADVTTWPTPSWRP
jgi:hypothetical protein